MDNDILELIIENSALKLGCEKALALLNNPDASEFDANKVIHFLESILNTNGG